jgi:succinoglycan biosynthesis transport protein ExoP
MTDDLQSGGRYSSARDYLRVLRRYRVMLVLITIVGAAAGYVVAKRQNPVYDSSATIAFQDPTQNLSLVGLPTSSLETPAGLAAIAAETAARPQIMAAVKSQLHTKLSTGALAGSTFAAVSANSGLLVVTAAASTPSFATALANALADQLVDQSNRATQAQFAAIAAATRRQIASLFRSHSNSAQNATELAVYQDELARLDTLSGFAKSAAIAEFAQTPGSPSSPKTLRSTIIGLLLGLLLGLAAAFGRDSIDRRLRTGHDVEDSFALPVIGHIRKQSMGKVAYLSDGAGPMDEPDLEAFRILRRNLESLDLDKPLSSVLVTSAIAEEGKTTVASSLAFAMAAAGKSTLLVDCDLRRPDLAQRIGLDQSPGISDYLAGQVEAQDILRTVTFAEPALARRSPESSDNGASGQIMHQLVCIPAGSVTSRTAELLGSKRFGEFIEQVTSAYEVVILDSSPLLPVADTLEMLPHAHAVIVCAREGRTTRELAATTRAALSKFPRRPAGIVVTGIRLRRTEYEVDAYTYSSG